MDSSVRNRSTEVIKEAAKGITQHSVEMSHGLWDFVNENKISIIRWIIYLTVLLIGVLLFFYYDSLSMEQTFLCGFFLTIHTIGAMLIYGA